jgi:heptosyltransferase III
LYCNKRINLSRKNSPLHEAQLNIKLLEPFNIREEYSFKAIENFYGFNNIKALPENISSMISDDKINVIFHPKSKGSAREWPLDNYFELARALDADKYRIFITGTASEGEAIQKENSELLKLAQVTDLTGKLNLEQLICFINKCNGLIACSTGPLHIGAALGKNVCGIYPSMKPIHPERWAPIGRKATFLVLKKDCSDCKKSFNCQCIQSISVGEVFNLIKNWKK